VSCADAALCRNDVMPMLASAHRLLRLHCLVTRPACTRNCVPMHALVAGHSYAPSYTVATPTPGDIVLALNVLIKRATTAICAIEHHRCFYANVLGPHGSSQLMNDTSPDFGIPVPDLLKAWEKPFLPESEGGCPSIAAASPSSLPRPSLSLSVSSSDGGRDVAKKLGGHSAHAHFEWLRIPPHAKRA
jgi:hypothetical protein